MHLSDVVFELLEPSIKVFASCGVSDVHLLCFQLNRWLATSKNSQNETSSVL
jgi:hypothetical protein